MWKKGREIMQLVRSHGPIKISQPLFGNEEREALLRVFHSGSWAGGIEVELLETEMAEKLGVNYAIAVSSGTAALEAALTGLGIGQGDEVITTAFSFFATAEAVLRVGAIPVFADIEPDTLNISPKSVNDLISSKTVAIIPVHLYGRPCNMDALQLIANRNGLAIIEDACQAIGASYNGRSTGSFGVGCFSFYGSKNITSGEGGMVTTNDANTAERIRSLRQHGATFRDYEHTEVATNWRMTDLQAAILREQLKRLEHITSVRQENAAYYIHHFAELPIISPPPNDNCYQSAFHQFTIRVPHESRESIMRNLSQSNIQCRIYYPRPIPELPALINAHNSRKLNVPESAKASQQVISIPVHPVLDRGAREYVAETLRSIALELSI